MEEREDAYVLIRCSACGGELHPVQPGSTAPEYFCPTAGNVLQLRDGDEVVTLQPRDDTPDSAHQHVRETMQKLERQQRSRGETSVDKLSLALGLIFWAVVLVGIVLWIRSCV